MLHFIDAGPLWSFAVVDRLDLLEARFSADARWTVEVQAEISRNVGNEPALGRVLSAPWLPDPIDLGSIVPSRATELLRAVALTQRALAGGRGHPQEHMGEASSIVAGLELGGCLVSEDADAIRHAKFRSLTAKWTVDIVQEVVAFGELQCEEAWQLYQAMIAAGRMLPNLSKSDLC